MDQLQKAFDALEEMAQKNKIKWTLTYSFQWQKWRLDLMGKKFLNSDLFECLKEAILYYANAEKITADSKPEIKTGTFPEFPPIKPTHIL